MAKLMRFLSRQVWWWVAAIVLAISLAVQALWTQPAHSTAAQPPKLVKATLGGKPVDVLYMTQAGDMVLVRCYPGFAPTLSLGAKQAGVSTTGTLKCEQEK